MADSSTDAAETASESSQASTATAGAEASLAELASIIGAAGAPATGAKPKNKGAAAKRPTVEDLDDSDDTPELDDADEEGADATARGAADDDDLGDEGDESDTADTSDEDESPDDEEAASDEAGTEETDDAADDDAPEDLDEADRKLRKTFTPEQQKRFDKALFKQRERFRSEIETLKAEVAEAKARPLAPAAPTPDNPLADVSDEDALAKAEESYRAAKRWARLHPDGGTIVDGQGKEIEVSREKALQMLTDAEEMLETHIPARREFLRNDRHLSTEAEQDYPWLKQKTSAGYVAVQRMLTVYGNTRLRDIPGIRGSLADLFVGSVIRSNQKQKAPQGAAAAAQGAAKKTAVPRAPATPAGGARPPKVSGATKQKGLSSKALVETGDDPGNATLGSLIGIKPTRR